MCAIGRLCSLIPGLGIKLSAIILAGPTVLSAVGASPPHDGVRRRWRINVASAVSLTARTSSRAFANAKLISDLRKAIRGLYRASRQYRRCPLERVSLRQGPSVHTKRSLFSRPNIVAPQLVP